VASAFLIPSLLGAALLLIVLALKPARAVGTGAAVFFVICLGIGIAQAIEAHKAEQQAAQLKRCLGVNPPADRVKKCYGEIQGLNLGFVGNEFFANE